MYKIYTTDGFVIASRLQGEASKTLTLFTEELGLLRVHAQGIRETRSKLRYGVQTLSWSRFSLVRGREIWRLTSVLPQGDGLEMPLSYTTRTVFARVLALVERLVHGEERDSVLYHLLRDTFHFLRGQALTSSELRQLELLTVVRILHHLGYVGTQHDAFAIAPEEKLTKFSLAHISGREAFLVQTVNASLKATQL